MTKPILALFLKSHVDTYTRKDGVVVHAHDTKVQKEMFHPESNSMRVPKLFPVAERKIIPVVATESELVHLRPPVNGIHSAAMIQSHPKENIAWLRAIGHTVNVLNEGDNPQVDVGKRSGSWHITDKKPKKDWRDEENWHTRTMMKFETLSDESLKYIIKDATEAADIAEKRDPNSKKAGQYRDECHYAHMELHKRRHAGSPMVRVAQSMQDHHAAMRAEKAEIDRAAKG